MAEADPMRTLYPLSDFVEPVDFLLGEYLSIADLDLCRDILVADARGDLSDQGYTLEAIFYFGALPPLRLPGVDLVDLRINENGFANATLICSDEPSLTVDEIEITISFDPSILGDGNKRGEITAKCGFILDAGGFKLTSCTGATLAKCHVAGTEATIEIRNISLAKNEDDWLVAQHATLGLPMFRDANDDPLILTGSDLAIGRYGPSGTLERSAAAPLDCKIFGFDCEIDTASLRLDHCALCDVAISGRIDISRFAPRGSDGFVDVDFTVGTHGVSATLHNNDAILELKASGVFSMSVTTLRLDEGVLWLSGELTPEIEGVDGNWPTFSFEEIGITPSGEIRLAAGASLATDQPFSVDWGPATLTVTAFSLERPDDAPDDLELRLSAGIELVKGLPAGASVDGLVARWHRQGPPSIRFDGIGLHYGTPGAFDAAVTVAWGQDKGFSGSGHLDLSSIDLRLDVIFGLERTGRFNTLFLTAETSIPGGIPIAATGLSLYGVSGLLAHNMEIDAPGNDARRYFDKFIADPPGFAAKKKWKPVEHSEALGLGVLIGSGDDGWTFSSRGGLILSLPDLSILVTATADLLAKRKALTDKDESKLSAVLAVHPALQLLQLDYAFEWDQDPLFHVAGSGGGQFHFDRPLDGLIWAGKPPEEGSPITADYFRLGSDWLLTAGYWLSIGLTRGVEIGLLTHITLHENGSSIYAGLDGRLRGQLNLAFSPFQFEGKLDISAHGELKAGGIGIDLGIIAGFKLMMPHPQKLEVPLSACISFDIGIAHKDFCLDYTFLWERADPPELESLVHGISFLPRDWVPFSATSEVARFLDYPGEDWGVGGERGESEPGVAALVATPAAPAPAKPIVETGIVQLSPAADIPVFDLGEVHPHSVIAIEFAKSLLVDLHSAHVDLGTPAVPFPRPVGTISGYSEQWTLDGLSLVDLDANLEVDLFGAFSLSTAARESNGKTISPRPTNTELRLFTSHRFGQPGSLSGGGVEQVPPPDCHRQDEYRRCSIDLRNRAPGFGGLDYDWYYAWRPYGPDASAFRGGIAVAGDDFFLLDVPAGYGDVGLTFIPYHGGPIPPEPWVLQTDTVAVPSAGALQVPRNRIYTEIFWWQHIAYDGTQGPRVGEGAPGKRESEVADDGRTLTPGHHYALTLTLTGRIFGPGRGEAHKGQVERRYTFSAKRAPAWDGALSRAVAAVNPADGKRPVFRHYDLIARFNDDIWAGLYRRDKRQLGLRVVDSNGRPVEVAPGRTVTVPTAWARAPRVMPPAERWWQEARAAEPGNECAAVPAPPGDADTVLAARLDLAPFTRYRAEIVAIDAGEGEANMTAPLMSWSFTTSAYKTFSDLARAPVPVPAFGLVQLAPPADEGFDALVAAFGASAIACLDTMRMTPLAIGDKVTHVLIEAPEPLADRADRLTIEVEGIDVHLIPNRDWTRLIARLAVPKTVLSPADTLAVTLHWNGAAGAEIEDRRMINGVATIESCPWVVPLKGVL